MNKSILTAYAVLLLAFLVFVFGYNRHVILEQGSRLRTEADYLGANLWFLNQAEARSQLEQIARVDRLLRLELRHPNGAVFAEFDNPEALESALDRRAAALGLTHRAAVTAAVLYRGQVMGYLKAEWLNRAGYVGVYALVLTVCIGVIIGYQVSLRQNYRRLHEASAILRERDEALQRAHNELEARVQQRTAELFAANQSLRTEMLERQNAQEAMRASEAQLREAQQLARLASWCWDLTTGRMIWAPLLCELHALPPASTPDYDLLLSTVHPADRARVASTICDAMHGRVDTFTLEYRVQTDSGELRHMTTAGHTTRAADGHPATVMGIVQDVTARRLMEERLLQAEKLEAIGLLAGGVAHDFNNQLCGIMGYADMLSLRLADSELRDYADNILRAAQNATDLTKDLLAFARKGKYLSVPVDLHQIISDVVTLLGRSIDKRIDIRQAFSASVATVVGDPGQLRNALLNLAVNARDAMPTGGQLTFATAAITLPGEPASEPCRDLTPGAYLRLAVTDTGTGMNQETKRHLFEPFFTTKDPGKGTGIGLASVYGAVKNHHGAIAVDSEPGMGTTFTLYLPLSRQAPLAAPTVQAPLVTGKARLLVAEDEPLLRDLAVDMLTHLGYEVHVCCDGEEAVQYYRVNWQSVDLVILDMIMPRLGGRDTFLAMRAINPQVRVLLASGYSLDGEARSILSEGVMGFAQKPYATAELSRQVAAALSAALPA